MMTPSRFAMLVLVTAVMLPISPNVSAMGVVPVNDLLAEPLTTRTAGNLGHSSTEPSQSPVPPLPYPPIGRTKIDCKCLYFDWWYDTGGLWVRRSIDEMIAI